MEKNNVYSICNLVNIDNKEVTMDLDRFPEYIENRIDYEFLTTFKEEFDKVFADDIEEFDEELTYYTFYSWRQRSTGFTKALKSACETHDFMELYDYLNDMDVSDSEAYGDIIMNLLIEYGIIEEGSVEDLYPPYDFDLPDFKDAV